jgi:hypothetical protein
MKEFIAAMKDKSVKEIILLADQEATEAERNCYRTGQTDCCRSYANRLKDLIFFLRYPSFPNCCPVVVTAEEAIALKGQDRISAEPSGK